MIIHRHEEFPINDVSVNIFMLIDVLEYRPLVLPVMMLQPVQVHHLGVIGGGGLGGGRHLWLAVAAAVGCAQFFCNNTKRTEKKHEGLRKHN